MNLLDNLRGLIQMFVSCISLEEQSSLNVRSSDHFMTDEWQMSDLLHRLRSELEQLGRKILKFIISKIVIRSPFLQIHENRWSEIKLINRYQSIMYKALRYI